MAEYKLSYTASEIDEKLGKVATPDWNASEGESGYVKNRTHYNNVFIDLEFNGDFSNAIEGMFAKVSDTFYDANDLLGADITLNYAGQEGAYTIQEEDLITQEYEGFKMVGCTAQGLPEGTQYLMSINMEMEGIPAGTYIANMNNGFYVSKIYKGELKQLDKVFIPNYDNLATKEDVKLGNNRLYEYIGEYICEAEQTKHYEIKFTEKYSKVYVKATFYNGSEPMNITVTIADSTLDILPDISRHIARINARAEGLLFVDTSTIEFTTMEVNPPSIFTRYVLGEYTEPKYEYIDRIMFNTEENQLPRVTIKVWGVKAI